MFFLMLLAEDPVDCARRCKAVSSRGFYFSGSNLFGDEGTPNNNGKKVSYLAINYLI